MAKSLKKCIETLTKSGELSQDLANDIQGAVTSLVADGYTAKDAAVAAINDAISDLRAELSDVKNQVTESNAVSDATLARTKDRSEIRFSVPYVGKTGAKLVGYVWPNKKEEYIDNRGEDRVRTVSDWEYAVENLETGRQIVHQFFVQKPGSEEQQVSAESAAEILGISEGSVRSNAKKLLEREIKREKDRIAAIASADKVDGIDAAESPAAAVDGGIVFDYALNAPMIRRMQEKGRGWKSIDDRIERESASRETYRFMERDGKYIWTPNIINEGSELAQRGWKTVELRAMEIWPAEQQKRIPMKGDRFKDAQGKEWEIWNARSSLIEAFPVVDGKIRVNNQEGQRFATDDRAKFANPEARTDYFPMPKAKAIVTPQILTTAQFNSVIQIAADSIDKLRKSDVARVIEETPESHRADMASRIKEARADLSDEVNAVLAEQASSSQSVDYKGFLRVEGDGGTFYLEDGNMRVKVEPQGSGKFQASFRGAKSSPHIQGEQGAVDWADAYREDGKSEVPAPSIGSSSNANTDDAGEELKYNKRNRVIRLKWDDIKDQDAALKVKQVVKAKVLEKPDYQAMIDGGMQPLIAHIVKQVYDGLAAKPQTRNAPTDEQLQLYIDGMNRVMDGAIAWAESSDSIDWLKKIGESASVQRAAMTGSRIDLSAMAGGKVEFKKLLEHIYPEGWKEYRAELTVIGGNRAIRAMQPGLDETIKALKEIEKGWPGKREAWQVQGYSIKEIAPQLIATTYYEGKTTKGDPYVSVRMVVAEGRQSLVLYSDAVDGAEKQTDSEVQKVVKQVKDSVSDKFVLFDNRNRMVASYETEEQAKEGAREKVKRAGGGGIREEGISVQAARRVGEARREEGENITSDKLIQTFGFRGVNFGNWMKGKSNEAERQFHLNHAYDAFLDLAEILGVPPKAMSLNGMLGLAIGAQGNGKAAAHFVPGLNEINITRTAGAGAVAHEWGHALDHYFARLAGLERETEPFLTEHAGYQNVISRIEVVDGKQKSVSRDRFGKALRPEVLAKFKAIVEAMNKRQLTQEEIAERKKNNLESAKKNVDRWLDSIRRDYLAPHLKGKITEQDFDAIATKIRNMDLGTGEKVKLSKWNYITPVVAELRALYKAKTGYTYSADNLKALQSWMDSIEYATKSAQEDADHKPQTTSTTYAANASKLDRDKGGKKYWSTDLEKFARAFDAFVFDQLEERAAKNTYLAGLNNDIVTSPMGEERKAINSAFKDLVDTIETRETDSGVEFNSIEPGTFEDVSADRESAITRAIDRAIAMEQGKEVAPLRRLMVRNRLGKLRADLESGKIEDGAFIFDVNQLHRQMEDAYQARQYESHKGRERGADWIRQKLLEAKRRGDIGKQAADMAEWFVLQNPSLVEDLGISLRTKQEGAASGNYNPATRVMTLFKGQASDTTAVHEILHHLERMMPAEMQEQIRLEWIKQVTKELQKSQKAGDQKRIDYFTAVLAGDQKKATEILTGRAQEGFNAPPREENDRKSMKQEMLKYPNLSFPLTMPQEMRDEILKWNVVSQSPYSESFYDITNKGWENDPDTFLRVADHWAFESGGRIHAQTDIDVEPGNWTLAEHGQDGIYRVIKSVPRLDTDSTQFKENLDRRRAEYEQKQRDAADRQERIRNAVAQAVGVDIPDSPTNPLKGAGYQRKTLEKAKSDKRRSFLISRLFPKHIDEIWITRSSQRDVVSPETAAIPLERLEAGYAAMQKESAPTPDSGELGSQALSNQDAGAASLRADESGQLEEPAQSGSGAGSNATLSEKVGAGNTANDLDIGRDYRYLNPSEFWAVSMADAVSSRFKAKDSIWSRTLQWLREALEHIKSVLGLDSTYPMLKAMESIAKGDGSFVSREMLGSAQVYAAPSLWNKSLPAEKPRAKTRIIGDSGREYTADQQVMFRQTGREVDSITTLGKIRQWASLNWKQGIFDQFQPVRSITDKGYTLLRLSKGATGAFEALMHHGKLSLRDGAYDADTSGGVMQEVFIPLGKETTDFLYWIAGNRAERLAMEGKERLFSAQDIAAAKSLAQGTTDFDYVLASGKVTRDRTLIYSDSLARFNAFNKNVMDMAEQSGLIDGASRHLWEHEFYVPFYRVVDEKDGGVRGMNIKTGVIRQEAFKKLKGGKEGLNDLLANTLMNWAHLIDASAKNRAAKETLEAAGRLGAAAKAVPGEKNTVWYMDGGKRVEYSISDPELLVAISSLDYTGLRGGAMDALSMMKHWLTIGVTASPFFKVRNLIRDSVQAVATSGLSYNIAGNVVNGMRLTNRENPEYVSALAGGGLIRFGTMLEGNEAARTRQLIKKGAKDEHILDNETKLRAFYDKWLEPGISAYNELGNRGEEINRMSLYDQLIKQGVDHATASLMARDLMDFSMQGSWTAVRFLAQTVPFFNARLQGMYKLGRSIKGDPAKFVVVLGVVALLSLSLMMAYDDDDDWKKREDWDRDNYWWFKFGGIAYRIPKPFEIGAMATFAERSAELMFSNEMTGKRFREVTWKLLMDQLSMNPVPQLVKPIIDIYANTDSFTKRPIETMGMERLDRERRFNSNTSMPARGLSAAIGGALSPVQIDHLVRGYFGWLGAFAIGAGDIAVRLADDSPDRPSLDYWKFATGGMIAELDSAGSRYVTQMYQQAKEIETAYGTWRDLQKQAGRMQGAAQESAAKDAAEYRKQHQTEIRQYSQIESAKRHISGMNERIRRIEQSNMSSREKRDAIVNINKLKNQTAKRLVTAHTD